MEKDKNLDDTCEKLWEGIDEVEDFEPKEPELPTDAPIVEELPIFQDEFQHKTDTIIEAVFNDEPEPVVRHAYRDAGYIPEAEDCSPKFYKAPPIKEPKPKSEGFSASAVVALCLCCSIIAGIAGGFVGVNLGNSTAETEVFAETVVEPTQSPLITSTASNGTMEVSELYAMGCEQTVGITSDITTTNFFGMTSSSSVSGSGFIITEDGYIMTNYHVIEDAYLGGYDITVMLYDGRTYVAEIVGFEDENDVAILKIEATGLNAVNIGSNEEMQVGDTVYAIGNPLGELAYTMTDGIVSATDRLITTYSSTTGISQTISMFQITAAINEGNSGGPVYNETGQVIGMATAKYSDTGVEGLGFAVPIDDAIDIANDIIENGYVTGKAVMGIGVQTVTESASQYYNLAQGAYIVSVNEGSAAETAGLKIGDVITSVDGIAVTSLEELQAVVRTYNAGDTAELVIWRSGEYQSISISFDEEVPDTAVNN